jgi:hypothetical protein
MKKLCSIHVAVLCLCLLAGCKKNIHIPDTTDCRIEKINSDNGSAVFAYNQWGNPVSIITGYQNLVFKYDKFNRLSEFAYYYNNGFYQN